MGRWRRGRRAGAVLAAAALGSLALPGTVLAEYLPPTLERTRPTPRVYQDGDDFETMEHSGTGSHRARLTAVDLRVPPGRADSSTSGCEKRDFEGFPRGTIALLQRGKCLFRTKAQNALEAGAVGVIVFNEGNPGRTDAGTATLGPPTFPLPVVLTSFEVGDELRNGVLDGPTGATVWLQAHTPALSRGRLVVTVLVGALVLGLLVWVAFPFERRRRRRRRPVDAARR